MVSSSWGEGTRERVLIRKSCRRRAFMPEFPFTSMRDWLQYLEDNGELLTVNEQVDLRGGVAALAYQSARSGLYGPESGPALLFTNIKGYPGWRIATNAMYGRHRLAKAMDVSADPRRFYHEVVAKIEQAMPPMEVTTAPCKEIIWRGEEADLARIPVPFTGELEGVPNITAGISNIREPDTGWQNIAVRRFGVKGSHTLSEFLNRTQQDYMIFMRYIDKGQPAPVAIIIGADPVTYIVSQIKMPIGFCEYDIWGGITGSPLEVVQCETSDLLVPASAEVVIEGEILPDEFEVDGPFPEFELYYTILARVVRVRVKCITMRKDPIYYYMLMGVPPTEGHSIGGTMIGVSHLRGLLRAFPGIINLHVPHHQYGHIVVVQVAKEVAKAWSQFAVQVGFEVMKTAAFKGVIVVDEDCEDITNWEFVLDEIQCKFQASKDLTIIPRMVHTELNPSEPWAGKWGWNDRFIIDATEPPPGYDEGYLRGKGYPPKWAREEAEKMWPGLLQSLKGAGR
ncbi:MAG: UbiD family decarboxylase [Clostridia bacterium]|nr:MAG: UbiD family decarboxylase [Clostridia bacterium]